MERLWQKIPLWLIAISCFLAGLYFALNHSYELLKTYNYLLGPIGDQAEDTARIIYPVIDHQKGLGRLLSHFADHRVLIERLMVLYDFFWHSGIEDAHRYRILSVLWLTALLLSLCVFRIKSLPAYCKILFMGCALGLTFSGISLINYGTSILFTWPLINLFSLLSFISISAYCEALQHQKNSLAKLYLLTTSFFVVLAIYTFNIGLFLWPVLFIVLYKKKTWQHRKTWFLIALTTYVLFFWNWHPPTTGAGIRHFIQNPFVAYEYLGRLLSIPVISYAPLSASIVTNTLGLFVIFFVMYYLFLYWQKREWTSSETIIFSFLLFNFIAILLISVMRAYVPAEYASIGLRFTTPTLMMFLSLAASVFIFYYPNNTTQKSDITTTLLLNSGIAIWLVVFFLPNSMSPYNLGNTNQYFIALTTGIPIDNDFIKLSRRWDTHYLRDVRYNTLIQQKYGKGAFSLWPAQHLNEKLSGFMNVNSGCLSPKQNLADKTIPKTSSPVIFLESEFSPQTKRFPTTDWLMVITNVDNKIIGYGLPTPEMGTLLDRLQGKRYPEIWRGAANTSQVKNKTLYVYFIDPLQKLVCSGGTLKI